MEKELVNSKTIAETLNCAHQYVSKVMAVLGIKGIKGGYNNRENLYDEKDVERLRQYLKSIKTSIATVSSDSVKTSISDDVDDLKLMLELQKAIERKQNKIERLQQENLQKDKIIEGQNKIIEGQKMVTQSFINLADKDYMEMHDKRTEREKRKAWYIDA
jgi:hypothetical protein